LINERNANTISIWERLINDEIRRKFIMIVEINEIVKRIIKRVELVLTYILLFIKVCAKFIPILEKYLTNERS
jgi:hypothetical protein